MAISRHLQQAQRIILVLIAVQGALLALMFSGDLAKVPAYLGFVPGLQGTAVAWALATLTTIAYVWSASTIAAVKTHLFRLSRLKLLAVICALLAGIVEEVIFRKILMDFLVTLELGPIIQVAVSAMAFGLAHAVWGLKRVAAGINAVFSTTLLGAALAIVYLAGERSLAPCVVAHVVITALIEPGLILAAISDRLGFWREKVTDQ